MLPSVYNEMFLHIYICLCVFIYWMLLFLLLLLLLFKVIFVSVFVRLHYILFLAILLLYIVALLQNPLLYLFFVLTGKITVICCYNQQASVEQHPTLILKQTHWSRYLYSHTQHTEGLRRRRRKWWCGCECYIILRVVDTQCASFLSSSPTPHRHTYALVYLTKCAKIFLIVEKSRTLHIRHPQWNYINQNAEKRRCYDNSTVWKRKLHRAITHIYFQHYKMQIIWAMRWDEWFLGEWWWELRHLCEPYSRAGSQLEPSCILIAIMLIYSRLACTYYAWWGIQKLSKLRWTLWLVFTKQM